jgi:hypothetical protein
MTNFLQHILSKYSRSVCIGICLILLTLGYVTYEWLRTDQNIQALPRIVREDSSQYKFINPILWEVTDKSLYVNEFKDLVGSLNSFVSSAKNSGTADSVSIYYRDMNTGHWTGINEDEKYEPASMLKVLLMMSALQVSLEKPGFLSEKFHYAGPIDTNQTYKPTDNLPAGSYSIQELIDAMVTYSDNGAAETLGTVPEIRAEYDREYQIFHLPDVASSTPMDYMSPRSYSVLYRSLYNGAFFPEDLSEQVLELLADTTFTEGIVSGVPKGVVVSHKFGEYGLMDQHGSVSDLQLHDCGIVYYPKHPYLLCIMTKGKSYTQLSSVIEGISKTVYTYVQNANSH